VLRLLELVQEQEQGLEQGLVLMPLTADFLLLVLATHRPKLRHPRLVGRRL